ncbi:MAG: SAM-dependent chlorinase/fluorinase [Bacteroidetes bacterium]|nr:SAM-dependent chlorinase/fluorinase [Bacteroidota bacterium]
MPIITLTTDWGLRDHYLAAFKGELISRNPAIQLVDISHDIQPFDILQASFVIKNCFNKFPPGTLHFIGISGSGKQGQLDEKRNYLMVKSNDHFFTGEDSGLFSLVLGESEKEIYKLPVPAKASLAEVYDHFLSTISSFAEGRAVSELGEKMDELVQSFHTFPTVDHSGSIRGSAVYIDSFGNIISNITRELFDTTRKGRSFMIYLRKAEYDMDVISNNYFDVEPGEMAALFNHDGYLEIAMNQDNAASMLRIKLMDTIRIEFT